ncbi:hypothetical protein Q1695_006077 [Nippostrongylus brasiliensis]|nr:hypothetical protein Q1695_006077 [Nippostrongylus brasiliensis]
MSLRRSLKLLNLRRSVICSPAWKAHASTSSSVDKAEIVNFSRLSSEWNDENGPFKALHSLNMLRIPWILQNLQKGKTVADIGCGGGLLSVPLARAGMKVVGVDAAEDAVKSARMMLESEPMRIAGLHKRISFHYGNIEDFSREHEREFDAVVASEIVEHVSNLDSFVEGCCRLAKPGAPLFFTTINKTLASRLLAVWLAEDVLKFVPQGVHQWERFVEPSLLSSVLKKNGCTVRMVNGFTYNPLTNVWRWIPSTTVNYALMAVKN